MKKRTFLTRKYLFFPDTASGIVMLLKLGRQKWRKKKRNVQDLSLNPDVVNKTH